MTVLDVGVMAAAIEVLGLCGTSIVLGGDDRVYLDGNGIIKGVVRGFVWNRSYVRN